MALVTLKPDHLTLSGAVLDQLAAAESAVGTGADAVPESAPVGAQKGMLSIGWEVA